MIHPRYHDAFRALTSDEVDSCLEGLTPTHPDLLDLEDFDGEQLLAYCLSEHISQAELITSMTRISRPAAVAAVERLMLRPIDRRTVTEVLAAERLANPRAIAATISVREATTDARIIRLLTDANPKRPGTSAHDRFRRYRDGMTVAQFIAAGGTRGDISWDTERAFIRLDPEA